MTNFKDKFKDKILVNWLIAYVFVIVIVVFMTFADLDYITSPLLGLIGIAIAITIAVKQNQAIKKIHAVGKETKETAEALRLDSLIKERVKRFFRTTEVIDEKNKYKCIYPHKYSDRPLPSINAGDYYALSILERRLGSENIKLFGLSSDEEFDDSQLKGNMVVVCAHVANPVVRTVFEIHNIENDSDLSGIDSMKTPCWFADDSRPEMKTPQDKRNEPVRKIRVSIDSTNDLIESPAEDSYIKLHNDPMQRNLIIGIQQDYGILGRITIDDNTYFIIAGIHQYGTWVVATFLDRLLRERETRYEDCMLGGDDFIAVIWGEFDTSKMKVREARVHHNYLWVKERNSWTRHRDHN